HGRPVHGIHDDATMPDGNFGEVVPVAGAVACRHVTVGQIQVERAVVVEVAELRTPAPSPQVDAEHRGKVLVLDNAGPCTRLRHPQVVGLHEHTGLRDVRL